jgi:hypothetical protein
MDIEPVRAGPVFALTENITVPFPLPGVPDEMVIQEFVVDAVQAHPFAVVTAIFVPGPPAAGNVCDVGLI